MTKEQAIQFANCLKNNYTIDFNDMADFCDMAIKALEQELTPIKNERPTKCGNYLVQVASTDGTATIDYFDVDHFNGDGTWTHYTVGDTKKVSKNIVAWMHLPKVVKVGEVNDKRRRT